MRKTGIALSICCFLAAASGGTASAYTRPAGVFEQVDAQPGESAGLDLLGPGSKRAVYSSMSDSGRYVAFDTLAALLPVDTNQASDVYLRDMKTRKLTLVSIGERGVVAAPVDVAGCNGNRADYGGDALSWDPAISGDARFVAFVSLAPNLVMGDTNDASDVFLYDVRKQETERISLTSEGEQLTLVDDPVEGGPTPTETPDIACPSSWGPSLDRHGRFATFTSDAVQLAENRHDGTDVYLRDLTEDTTERISVPVSEVEPNPLSVDAVLALLLDPVDSSSNSSLSADGRFVAFDSGASDLIEGDTNRAYDVFIRDLKTGKTERVSIDSTGGQIGGAPSQGFEPYWQQLSTHSTLIGDTARGDSDKFDFPQHPISADGRFVVFVSDAERIVPSDGRSTDVFVRDRKANRTERISVTSIGQDLGTLPTWFSPSISRDGRFVTLEAYNESLKQPEPGSPDGIVLFVFDRHTGAQQLLGRTSTGGYKTGCSDDPNRTSGNNGDISQDGRFVTFNTCDPNLLESPWKQGNGDYSSRIVRQDRGFLVGVGLGSGGPNVAQPDPDPGICVGNVCIPPLGYAALDDEHSDVPAALTSQGANLYGASVAYRPQLGDLFVTLELTDLPVQNVGSVRGQGNGSAIVHGFRFDAQGHTYEVRATSRGGGTFALFDCASATRCDVSELAGGYGTTGVRLVFSVPLSAIDGATNLTEAEAFTALGTLETGAIETIDRLPIKFDSP